MGQALEEPVFNYRQKEVWLRGEVQHLGGVESEGLRMGGEGSEGLWRGWHCDCKM